MMTNPKFLIYHDLVGVHVLAKPRSMLKDKDFSSIGIVVDETRDILITRKEEKFKKYIKKDYIFRFEISNPFNEGTLYYLEVQGTKIVGLPINRLRSLKKKRWLIR